jgi:hypothetical protein
MMAVLLFVTCSAVTASGAGLVRGHVTSATNNQALAYVRVRIQGREGARPPVWN